VKPWLWWWQWGWTTSSWLVLQAPPCKSFHVCKTRSWSPPAAQNLVENYYSTQGAEVPAKPYFIGMSRTAIGTPFVSFDGRSVPGEQARLVAWRSCARPTIHVPALRKAAPGYLNTAPPCATAVNVTHTPYAHWSYQYACSYNDPINYPDYLCALANPAHKFNYYTGKADDLVAQMNDTNYINTTLDAINGWTGFSCTAAFFHGICKTTFSGFPCYPPPSPPAPPPPPPSPPSPPAPPSCKQPSKSAHLTIGCTLASSCWLSV
jgi:hypothetical protein